MTTTTLKSIARQVTAKLRRSIPLLPTYWSVALLVLISICVLFWRLDQGSLRDWDEAIYAQVSKEMLRSRSWLTPLWEYRNWFHKPPLFIWITVIFYWLFEVNEFWSRAASALSGVGLLVVTYSIGKFVYDKGTGFLSAVVLLTSYAFVMQARFGTMDIMLTLYIYLSLYAYLHIREGKHWWWYVCWFFCALSIMTKGGAGLAAPFTIAVAVLLDKRIADALRSRYFWKGFLLGSVVAAPWHIFMYLQHGGRFINEYFGYHIVSRATTALEGNTGDRTYYFEILKDQFTPWFYLIPFAIAFSLSENIKGESRSRILLLVTAIVFITYTVIRTKIPWYIVPVYPALSILTAALLIRAYKHGELIVLSGLVVALFALVFVAPVKIVLLFGATGALMMLLKRKLDYRPALLLIFAFFIAVGLNNLRPLYDIKDEPAAELARIVASTTPEDRGALIVYDSDIHPTPLFYSDRIILSARTQEDLMKHIENHQIKGIILRKESFETLSEICDLHVHAEAGSFVYATYTTR
jgi:4-amino-4-deoxy-L-arabinose transferase-like glycosyltransferase